MEIITKLTLEEYLRFVCSSRGVRVKKDSEFAGYSLNSLAGEIGYGFPTKENAFREFCKEEDDIDVDFIERNLDRLTLREGDEVTAPDGQKGVVAEIFSKSGLIESPRTKINIADANDKVFKTINYEMLKAHQVSAHSEFKGAASMESSVHEVQSKDIDAEVSASIAPKKSAQYSFNF
ncbi:hypothetical protein CL689_03890 [Candidatus Saccharibacteria bacterium]|mgnify:CR=1 FL=1|nr:hypothetical protein [Candidatus Saccharibacteria bacterium]